MLLIAKRELDVLRASVINELKNTKSKEYSDFNRGVLAGLDMALTSIKKQLKEV